MFTNSFFLLLLGPLDPSAAIFEMNGCSACHSGSIQGTIEDRLFIEDPEAGFEPIETYEEGKTYRVRVSFNPIANAGNYRVAFRIGAFRMGQVAGEFETPAQAGGNVSEDGGWMAARIDTANQANASQVTFNWTAPEHGKDVTFFLSRVESNRNGLQGGDRGSSNESMTLFGLNEDDVDPDSDDKPSGGSGNGDSSNGPSSDSEEDTLKPGPSSFGQGFTASCGLRMTDQLSPGAAFAFLLAFIAFLILIRRTHLRRH